MPVDLSELTARQNDDGNTFYVRSQDGRSVCGSRLRRRPNEVRCGQSHDLSPSNGRCYLHGKDSPGGPLVSGRYSKSMNKLQRLIVATRDDPGLFDMRTGLAVLNEALVRAGQRIDESDTPDFRKQALSHFNAARSAQRNGDAAALTNHMQSLSSLLVDGVEADEAFKDAVHAAQLLAVEQGRAWQVRLSAAHAINARDLTALFTRLIGCVREELSPDDARRVVERMQHDVMPDVDRRHVGRNSDERNGSNERDECETTVLINDDAPDCPGQSTTESL